MKPEDMFGRMLGLGDAWEVTEARYQEAEKRFVLRVRETDRLWPTERCPHDGATGIRCYDHVGELEWRHLNVFDKECLIVCVLPRGQCRQCGRVYRVTPPWEGRSRHFTKEFEAFALTLMREMPVKKAGDILGETDTRMWRVLQAHVDEAYAALSMENVTRVAVDEMSRRKGQNYLSVFADLDLLRVIFATEGRDATTWDRFREALLAHNGHPHALREVSMDMSPAYRKGVQNNCRNARIVFDKFHVLAHANAAVDQVRRAEVRLAEGPARQQLKRTRWLWLKNPTNLTPKDWERFGRIDQSALVTAKAYQMRLALQSIYGARTARKAAERLAQWCAWVKRQAAKTRYALLGAMVKVAQMIEKHAVGILAHWDHGTTNAYMEGLMSVFSAVKRRARGYRSSQNLIAMLYFVAGKLPAPIAAIH